MILLIWFPLLFFSFSSTFFQSNPPKEVSVQIKLGGYLPIYQMSGQHLDLQSFTLDDSRRFRDRIDSSNAYPTLKDRANGFLRDFNSDDIRCVNLFSKNIFFWEISEPIRDIIMNNLRSNVSIPIEYSYTITRNPSNVENSAEMSLVVSGERTWHILPNDTQLRTNLIQILNGSIDIQTKINVTIPNLIPRFLHVRSKAKPDEVDAFRPIFPSEYYGSITMGLNRSKSIPNSSQVWWEMWELRDNYTFIPSCSYSNRNYLNMILFNDKISPANISFLTRYGIIGLYTTFVIVVARLLRTLFQTSRMIMFNELPSVERLWHLLKDIYLVREHYLFRIEEQLFAKLLFLYRSPSTLIRFTKSKSE